jgi:hypothetical protein
MPKSLQRIKAFDKWRENIQEYFAELSDNFFEEGLEDVDKMEPYQILKKIIEKLGKNIIILIDNFEAPLLSALKGGILTLAQDYYKNIFPIELG